MKELTEKEWQTLRIMCRGLLENIRRETTISMFWVESGLLTDDEVELLKKIVG